LEILDRNHRYEVLNFGVLGYNTAQEYERLKRKAIAYNPAIVVLYYGFNDPEIVTPIDFTNSGFLVHMQLFRFVKYYFYSMNTLDDLRRQSKNINEYYNRLHSSFYFDACKKIIQEMADYLAVRNIRFYLLIAPEVFQVKDFTANYPYHGIHRKLTALSSPKITVVDPLPTFARYLKGDPSALMVTPYDPHKNARGNWVVSAVLADTIYRKMTRASDE
jgi:hypothetical protein